MKNLRIKTLLVTFICIILTVCLLTACGESTPSASATPAPNQSGSGNTGDEYQYLKAGDTYTYYAWYVTEGQELFGSDAIDTNRKKVMAELEENYGITYNYLPLQGDGFASVFSSALSGTPIADAAHMGNPGGTMGAYYYEGQEGAILVNLTESGIDFDDPEYFDTGVQDANLTFNGSLYGWCILPQGFASEHQVCFVNKSLLQEANHSFEEIYNLVKSGEWTWAKFKEYVVNCANTADGVYGITRQYTVRGLTHSNDVEIISDVERNGIVTPTFTGTDKKALDAYNFYVDLYKTGAVQSIDDTTAATELFVNGSSVFMFTYLNRTADFKYMDSTVDYGVCPIPKGPAATEYISENSWFNSFSVFKGHSNPQGVIKATKEIFKPEYAKSSEEWAAAAEVNLLSNVNDEMSYDMLLGLSNGKTVYSKTDLFTTVTAKYCDGADEISILNGEKTADQHMKSIEAMMNTVLDSSKK